MAPSVPATPAATPQPQTATPAIQTPPPATAPEPVATHPPVTLSPPENISMTTNRNKGRITWIDATERRRAKMRETAQAKVASTPAPRKAASNGVAPASNGVHPAGQPAQNGHASAPTSNGVAPVAPAASVVPVAVPQAIAPTPVDLRLPRQRSHSQHRLHHRNSAVTSWNPLYWTMWSNKPAIHRNSLNWMQT